MNKHWILLRGLGRDKRHWGSFLTLFQQFFDGDKVSAIDTLGNGEFSHSTSPLTIGQYTQHCRAQITAPKEKLHLVALSLGGMVAIDWAQRYPDEIASMTLINSSAANLTAWHKRIKFNAIARLSAAILSCRSASAMEALVLKVCSNKSSKQNQAILQAWSIYREINTTRAANLIRQLIAAARFRANNLQNVQVLILTSNNDRLVNTQASIDLARHYQATLLVHASAGHDLPLDDPHWVIAQIKNHLQLS
ncbi:alpha/beta fold hydrolase [Thalassotalea sp. PLHSN55]|uniref:alpha/beta fold hydrolase n=1 Tax=Thalassotalea sp. PLHSN55 TaxID=3435888 RepID=UPI003F82EF5A